ncbi:MAG TPA: hypothetical protein VEJ84_01395, partial [Acidimicrobiales bacterium]|nr:hypothetical protein [Acidimicrobiales bacterium]
AAPVGPAACRFEAEGLWGLLRRPAAGPRYTAQVLGAARPAWGPYAAPRLDARADAYLLVLGAAEEGCGLLEPALGLG